jgi:predicted metal-dependent HD superfamily phosphohydrolase
MTNIPEDFVNLAETHVRAQMETGLSDLLTYHRPWHTFEDVLPAARRLALTENLGENEARLLFIAVMFHDLGYLERYDHNEPVGARLAADFLDKLGVDAESIERVRNIILATRVKGHEGALLQHAGPDPLERIICDADLDNLGRVDFLWISSLIRKEMENHGQKMSDHQWFERQRLLLTKHEYYTVSAKLARDEGKRENLQKVEDLLREM